VDEVFAVVLEGGENYVTANTEEKKTAKKSPKTKTTPLPAVPNTQQNTVRCKS
jgi:hypothetical protein